MRLHEFLMSAKRGVSPSFSAELFFLVGKLAVRAMCGWLSRMEVQDRRQFYPCSGAEPVPDDKTMSSLVSIRKALFLSNLDERVVKGTPKVTH
jgi:hypothetical protein